MKNNKLLIFCIVAWILVMFLTIILIKQFKTGNTNKVGTVILEQTIPISTIIIEEKQIQEKDTMQLALDICKYYYSWEIADEIFKQCEKYNLPVYVAYALMYTESEFKAKAKSKKNCRGLFQTGEACLEDYNNAHCANQYSFDDMYKVRENIQVGLWHYQRYRGKVNDDWVKLYAIYNNGYTGYLQNGTANIQLAVDRFISYLEEMEDYFN